METSKKKMKFPSAFSILFIILLIAIGLTWLIPSGSYSKLSYDSTENHFIVKTHGIPDQSYPATEQTLNQYQNSTFSFHQRHYQKAYCYSRYLSAH